MTIMEIMGILGAGYLGTQAVLTFRRLPRIRIKKK